MKKLHSNNLSLINNSIYNQDDIVLIGGCFDLLHSGHLYLLRLAKKLGGKLLVAVLSDEYIKSYKDSSRPIQHEATRLEIIQSLRFVDHAILANQDPYTSHFLSKIKPRAIIIGLETGKEMHRQNKAKKLKKEIPDLEIFFLEKIEPLNLSTTAIIQKIKNL